MHTSARGVEMRGVCGGCAERLELELTTSDGSACRDCGRHQELCAVIPCRQPAARQTVNIMRRQRRQLTGAERVRTIERLAATRLGVRELGRRTGLAPSTISRWLKIGRCPALKTALESDALDIGRAKLLADAPEAALAELIPLASAVSWTDLARRVAALRDERSSPVSLQDQSAGSQQLRQGVRVMEGVSRVEDGDRPILERVRDRLDLLLLGQ